jgi:glycosyltransferase involved in cell wall biosynthesis
MGLYVLTSFWPTLRHIRRWKPDVMHVHFAMPTGLLAWAAHLLTRTPYVLTAHLGDVPGGVPDQTDRLFRIVGPIARRVWRAAAAATAVSSFVQRLATTAYGKPVTTIVNGIELSGAAAPSSAVPQERRLVFVGRFNPQKNPVLIIDALQQLSHLPWQLTMIGDGPLRTAVEERIAATGLSSRVQLTRWLAGPEVQRILGASDILLMPSLSEGMPVAAVEALKHGLAIVASDIPGVADVVEDGVNGTLSPVGDTDAFAQQLRRFLEDAELLQKMKAASWDKVRRFDLQAVTSEYERVLKAAAQ